MVRVRLSHASITAAAFEVVDADGYPSLSLSSVAARLEVRPSALYTHVDGMDGLHQLVATASTQDLADRVRDAAVGRAGFDAITAMCAAYRGYADTHPGRYATTMLPPDTASEELEQAAQSLLDVFKLVFAGLGLSEADADRAAATARTVLHGYASIRLSGGPVADRPNYYDDVIGGLLDQLLGR